MEKAEALQHRSIKAIRPSAAALSAASAAQSTEELISVNQRFQEFVYIVSHDLHAPLRQIVSFSKLLQDKDANSVNPEDEKDYLAHILRAGQLIQDKIDGLLRYSRLNTMALPPAEALDCGAVVENCLDLLKTRIEEEKAHITVATLPRIRTDVDQLHQLFVLLLDNALKFTVPDKEPRIEIDVQGTNEGWLFFVIDNGIGIPPAYREEAFQLFSQLNSPDTYPGIGMGLTLARKIVEHHGGRIWIEDGMEGGTKVCFTLRREE